MKEIKKNEKKMYDKNWINNFAYLVEHFKNSKNVTNNLSELKLIYPLAQYIFLKLFRQYFVQC